MMRLIKLIKNNYAVSNHVIPEEQILFYSLKLNKNHLFPMIAVVTIIGFWVAIIIALLKRPIFPIIHDIPLLHYMAQQILDGYIPYKDFFDHNMPGAYFIHMIALVFFGRSDEAWTIFNFLCMACTSVLAGLYCWRISRLSAFLIPALYACYTLLIDPFSFGQRDSFLVLFILLASLLFVNVVERSESTALWKGKRLFACGAALGFATIVKPTPAVLLIMFSIIIVVNNFMDFRSNAEIVSKSDKRRAINDLFFQTLFLFVGAITPSLLFGIWLLVTGGLLPFIEIMVKFNGGIYSAAERIKLYVLLILMTTTLNPLAINAPFLMIGFGAIRDKKYLPRILIIILALVFGAFHYLFQGKGWYYHLIPLSMFFLFLQGILCGVMLKKGLVYQAVALTWLLITVSLNISQLNNRVVLPDEILHDLKPAVPLLVEDIGMLGISESDSIQMMDRTDGGLHVLFLLSQRQATPFLYDFTLIDGANYPYIKQLQRNSTELLILNPPKLIVFFHNRAEPSIIESVRLTADPQLKSLLNNDYQRVIIREFYTIYERNQ